MKVYVVESGEYSDRGIEAVFLTLERAERYVDLFNRAHGFRHADIEEFETADEEPDIELVPYYISNFPKGIVEDRVREIAKSDGAERTVRATTRKMSTRTGWQFVAEACGLDKAAVEQAAINAYADFMAKEMTPKPVVPAPLKRRQTIKVGNIAFGSLETPDWEKVKAAMDAAKEQG